MSKGTYEITEKVCFGKLTRNRAKLLSIAEEELIVQLHYQYTPHLGHSKIILTTSFSQQSSDFDVSTGKANYIDNIGTGFQHPEKSDFMLLRQIHQRS